jgi:hypothetical protein
MNDTLCRLAHCEGTAAHLTYSGDFETKRCPTAEISVTRRNLGALEHTVFD